MRENDTEMVDSAVNQSCLGDLFNISIAYSLVLLRLRNSHAESYQGADEMSVSFVENPGIPGEPHRPTASN